MRPQNDIARRCTKLADWPELDRQAYLHAIIDDPFSLDQRPAVKWRPATRCKYQRGYGRWLTFSTNYGADLCLPPADRISPSRIEAYVAELVDQGVSAYTLRNRILELHAMMGAIAPKHDLSWLRAYGSKLGRYALQAYRPAPTQLHTGDVINVCWQELENMDRPSNIGQAVVFRNWLMLSFLAHIPIRRSNFSGLRIGHHLIFRNQGWHIELTADSTKNGRSYSAPVPPRLAASLDVYLQTVRPILARRRTEDRLWIGRSGNPITAHTIHICIRELTACVFGVAVGPHSFRHSLATAFAEHATANLEPARAMLGHVNDKTVRRHYNHASAEVASNTHASLIRNLRRKLAPIARKTK